LPSLAADGAALSLDTWAGRAGAWPAGGPQGPAPPDESGLTVDPIRLYYDNGDNGFGRWSACRPYPVRSSPISRQVMES
jgi:hypothetical protein